MSDKEKRRKLSWFALGGAALIAISVIAYRAGDFGGGSKPVTELTNQADDGMAGLEQRTRDEPENVAAWQALGWAHFERQDYVAAAEAYRQAARLSPDNAVIHSSLGEALVLASTKEPMPAEAHAAFKKAVELDAKDPRARYFLAVSRDLSGDHEGAIKDWLALLADTPVGAPWEEDLKRTIEQVGKINGIETAERIAAVKQPEGTPAADAAPVATRAIPGPSQDQLRAAAAMTPTEQRAMADEMVSRLEGRLRADPSNVDGWVMLMRSRKSLGQDDLAKAALDLAIKSNPGAASNLRQQADLLGIK
jgi:cytochrome c-type biogenesis protein CcmH